MTCNVKLCVLAAMADDRIDFIIPFHRSGWSKAERERMRNLGQYFDYTQFQNERRLLKNADGSFVRMKNGRYKTEAIKEGNLYPKDYWDPTKTGKQNAEIYLERCAAEGRMPKFARFLVDNGDGSFSLQKDGSTDGYWKLLIDYKTYDNQGNYAAQQPMQPVFNMEKARDTLAKYEGGANTLPVANDIVDKYVAWFKQQHPKKKYSSRYNSTKQFEYMKPFGDQVQDFVDAKVIDPKTGKKYSEMMRYCLGLHQSCTSKWDCLGSR